MPAIPNTLAEVSHLSDSDNAVFPLPLASAAFTFDSFGVAGFFGGDSSVAAMATANLIPGRRWAGWYNNPGSYEIAKQYGPLGGHVFDGLFPEGEHDPARLFKLDGREGPPFVAAHSGTVFQRTGHFAHLITSKATDMHAEVCFEGSHSRLTMGPSVTVVNLNHVSDLAQSSEPPIPDSLSTLWSLIPIIVSVGASVICALVADWFCFTSIVVGLVAHGFACLAIGSGKLTFKHPKPAENAPSGDGVLKGEKAWVIVIGAEGAVNVFTRGRFLLQYGGKKVGKATTLSTNGNDNLRHSKEGSDRDIRKNTGQDDHPLSSPSSPPLPPNQSADSPLPAPTPQSNTSMPNQSPPPSASSHRFMMPPQWVIGPCALLLTAQFLVQLLLIPLGTLFCQIMFIFTVFASWLYNIHLSSIDRDEIQMQILSKELQIEREKHIHKYELNTFTATVAFTCFVLAWANPFKDPRVFLEALLPNKTAVWETWKEKMSEKLRDGAAINFSEGDCDGVTGEDKKLLKTLFEDAEDAWRAWSTVRVSIFFP